MRLTLHQLRVFQAVAEHKSVTIASQHLHMTQPAVSNIVKQLQDYYGCALTEVINRQLTVTAFGKALLTHCKTIEATLNNAQTEIESLKGGIVGTIHVATVSTAKYFVPHLLGKFKQQHSDIHIKLTVCNRQAIIERLQENKDDFVIMSHPPSTLPVDCANFYDDELIVVAAPRYTKKKSQTMRLKELIDAPWIIRENGSGTRYATERVFKKYHFAPLIEMEIGDSEAIKQAVIANMGISIISKQSVKVEIKDKLMVALPVKEFPVKHKWYLVKSKNKTLSPIAKNFYTFVNKHQPKFIAL